MPRFDDSIVDCVVYLYPSEAAAEDGERIGGSGFLIGLALADENRNIVAHLPCVVANRHTIDRGSKIARLNTKDGKMDIVPLDQAEWICHPDGDDVALCPIDLTFAHRHNLISQLSIGRRDIIEIFDIGIGDDVFAVGRFINREGRQQNTPTIRFGNIAQMPGEPIIQDDGFAQESFLVEIRSISGYSGSPIFLYIPPQVSFEHLPEKTRELIYKSSPLLRKKRRNMTTGWGPMLIGVGYCYIRTKEPVKSEKSRLQIYDYYVDSNTGMMGVIPVWKVWDIIFGERMKQVIAAAEDRLRKNRRDSGTVLTSAESASTSGDDVSAR